MRQSTILLFGLTIFGVCSGCTMLGNPLTARTDPAETARDRQAAEVSALLARGDYEGAQRLIDAAKQNATPPVASVFDQTHAPTSEAEREKMIEQLLVSQPAEWRDGLRQKYAQLSTSRLQELVATEQQLRGLGQGRQQDPSIPTAVQEPAIQLAGNQQQPRQSGGVTQAQNSRTGLSEPTLDGTDGFGIRFPKLQQGQELHAPDPRPSGLGAGLQTQPRANPTGEAPRLPDGLDFNVSQAGHQGLSGPGAIQPVSGTQPHEAGYSTGLNSTGAFGPGGGQLGTNPFPSAGGVNGADAAGQLPQIIPGNSELNGSTQRRPATTRNPFPQSQFGQSGAIQPTAGYAGQPSPSNGGVALESRIEIDSGTVSGSATTQLGGSTNPFPNTGQSGVTGGFGQLPRNGLTRPGASPLPDENSATSGIQPGIDPITGQPTEQSLIPGVIRNGYESIQNLTTSVTERGRQTFGAFGGAGAEVAQPVQSAAASATQPATIDGLIAAIESDLARTAPGDTEAERLNHVRKQVNLRMLYLIADRIDQSIEPIVAADPADQEFWQQLFFAYVNYFDAQQMPHASDRATQTIDQLRTAVSKLRHRADLKLKNVTFCHNIVSFGDYERFSNDLFTAGQPLLLYSEVENFFSTRTETDRYRTVLKSQIEIYDNSNMQRPVITIPFDPSEDICRNHRRDFFHSYEFTVPQELQSGLYTLVLRVTDQLSQKVATSRLNFRVE
ncbi:MAG: hypothetical protein ACYTGL_09335 [Planctomycetota bacterium]|jgi:hypothetical protein